MEKDAIEIKMWREFFEKKYPKMFGDSSGTEMDIEVDTTMKTKPPIDREEKLRKVEEKPLSNKSNKRFTDYFDVTDDDDLTQAQKIIDLQKRLTIQQERRFTMLHCKGKYLKNAFSNRKKFIKKLWRK